MHPNKHTVFITVLFTLMNFGCASISATPDVSKSIKPNDEKAYIYGRLSKTVGELHTGWWTRARLAMVIENVDQNKKYHFEFELKNNEVRVLEVHPGTYRISGSVTNAKQVHPPRGFSVNGPFTVESGNAYYIGDMWYSWRGAGPYSADWFLEEVADRFVDASEELTTNYPHLGQLAQSNLMTND